MVELFSRLVSSEWCNLPFRSMQLSNDDGLIRIEFLRQLHGSRVQLVIRFTIKKIVKTIIGACTCQHFYY
ncbi:hypothetical protein BT93_E2008 [Corymbia citriodora subsp. variegata]|nr:hypothetical protein BT93_E2008 [Corymbia citriodora subsp. variegata]